MVLHEGDVGEHALALDIVGDAHDGCLSHGLVRVEDAFNLGSADAVARDIDDIIHTASDPGGGGGVRKKVSRLRSGKERIDFAECAKDSCMMCQ